VSVDPLDLDELVEHWTLLDGDRELVAGKRGATRLAFALMLKFYNRHGAASLTATAICRGRHGQGRRPALDPDPTGPIQRRKREAARALLQKWRRRESNPRPRSRAR
jgi:hypothetical protein